MPRVLLVNPHYYPQIFGRSLVKAATSPGIVNLGLPTLAASLRKAGIEVRIADLNLASDSHASLAEAVAGFRPSHVGFTFTTPLVPWVARAVREIKALNDSTVIMGGGPHASALPEDTLNETLLDMVVRGEGDRAIVDMVREDDPGTIPGVTLRRDGRIVPARGAALSIENLNDIPYPAYDLLDIPRYIQSRLSARENPVAPMETSRGCYAHCTYCNKNIFGYKLRFKSPGRVVDEMEYILSLGFREIHIIDDVFTADMKRAALICEEILRRGLKIPWYPRGGLRVDRATPDLLALMKRAGCYRVPFGVESGSQKILDAIKKGETLEEARIAVNAAKKAGLEVECYFMIGLPGETPEDVEKSIEMAKSLEPDFVKFAITIPLPGTEYFETLKAQGRIKSMEWEKYTFSTPPKDIYDHEFMDWRTIEGFYARAHRRFYFRPPYIMKRFIKGLRTGEIFSDIKFLFTTPWWRGAS